MRECRLILKHLTYLDFFLNGELINFPVIYRSETM